MPEILSSLSPCSRVAIIRLRSLGDCVLATPALRILKQTQPDLDVGVVVEDAYRAVFAGNPDVTAILPPRAAALRRWRPELTLNLHGGTRSALLTVASGARYRAGFAHFRLPALYNLHIPRAQEILGVERSVHTVEHVASAMFWLGAPIQEPPRARLFAQEPRTGHYAVLHPFASNPEKTWPPDHFCALAAHLRESGLEPIFTGAEQDDFAAFSEFRCAQGASLEEVKNLLAGASLFVGNDSGPAHMAAAFGKPVLVLFGESERATWYPWRTKCAVLTGDQGIRSIAVSDALRSVEELLPMALSLTQ